MDENTETTLTPLAPVTETEVTVETNAETAPKPVRKPRTPRSDKPEAERAERRPRATVKRVASTPEAEMAEFKAWLLTLELGITPSVHVNGPAFPTCVLAVDFGTPKKAIKLTTEQGSELVSRMRTITKTVMTRGDVKVGVLNDHSTGVWWTSIS
ncbi:unnamed protein product [Sphagnum tenellum]